MSFWDFPKSWLVRSRVWPIDRRPAACFSVIGNITNLQRQPGCLWFDSEEAEFLKIFVFFFGGEGDSLSSSQNRVRRAEKNWRHRVFPVSKKSSWVTSDEWIVNLWIYFEWNHRLETLSKFRTNSSHLKRGNHATSPICTLPFFIRPAFPPEAVSPVGSRSPDSRDGRPPVPKPLYAGARLAWDGTVEKSGVILTFTLFLFSNESIQSYRFLHVFGHLEIAVTEISRRCCFLIYRGSNFPHIFQPGFFRPHTRLNGYTGVLFFIQLLCIAFSLPLTVAQVSLSVRHGWEHGPYVSGVLANRWNCKVFTN